MYMISNIDTAREHYDELDRNRAAFECQHGMQPEPITLLDRAFSRGVLA